MITPNAATRVGLGTGPLGGLYADVSSAAARATVDTAWELGIRTFDTAPLYGSGLAEQRLGEALVGRARNEYTISTKVGRILEPGNPSPHFVGAPALQPVFDFTPDGIRRSLAESLERLQLAHVDLALLHDPDDHMSEARGALETVRELAPRVGVGTNVVATALAFVERAEVDVVLLAGRYTLLDRSAEHELLPLCAERGVSLTAAGVFNSGLLAGGSTFDYEAAPPELLLRRRALEEVCTRYDVPLVAAAIQFPLRHPGVTSILVGARSPDEIADDLRLLEISVPDDLWSELDQVTAAY
jgi:D-threo-aldose 1-dehydrogenase